MVRFLANSSLEQLVLPEKFAEYLCIDLDLPPATYVPEISNSIRTQVSEYRTFLMSSDLPPSFDSRVPIMLDIRMGHLQLRDRFEWDLSSSLEPEEFARILVADLGLGSEFVGLVAHSIRDQIFKIKQDGDIGENQFALESRLRGEEEAKGWCPSVQLVQGDLDDLDKTRGRKHRCV